MHKLIAMGLFGLFVALATPSPLVTIADAADMRTTNGKHYSRGPGRSAGRSFMRSSRPPRTVIVKGQNRGLIIQEPGLLVQSAKFDPEATRACRQGRLRRLGGGVAEFADDRFPAAYARDMSLIEGLRLGPEIYIFVNESSTACRVYTHSG
ncbi:MAG: hypothetical protein O3B74_01110 [Proteobacteria bacterium]|nr:hypothetical protein [Pseudomonadota bacterium]